MAVKQMRQVAFSRYLQQLSHLPSGTRLLDCGAATGFFVEVSKRQGFEAYAVELSHTGAEACREILGADYVYEGEIQDAWFPANVEARFEVITMIDFIEHVRDPRAVLHWAAAHLRPGGNLLLVTPRVDSLSHRLMGQRWFHYHLEHLWYFSVAGLTALLKEIGLTVTSVQPAYKKFSVSYAASLAQAYQVRDANSHSLMSLVLSRLDDLLPRRVRSLSFSLPVGEMLVYASL